MIFFCRLLRLRDDCNVVVFAKLAETAQCLDPVCCQWESRGVVDLGQLDVVVTTVENYGFDRLFV
jgi:hypothetical protein